MVPEVIMFDAGGTLVLQHPGLVGERLGMAIDPGDAFEAHYRTMFEFAAAKAASASVTWDWWLERYFERLGHPDPVSAGPAIDRGYMLWSWAIPDVIEAMNAIRGMGVRVSVVSNSDGSVAESLRLAGFDGVFEDVVDSEIVGVSKPDPLIFRIACDRLGVDPSSVWYVGDSMHHDVGGAVAAGLAGSWLVDPLCLYPDHAGRVRSVAELPEVIDRR